MDVLFAHADFVIVDKAPGIPTVPARGGGACLRDEVAAWARERPRGASREPHAVSRLDTGVSGAVPFAMSEHGAARFVQIVAAGKYRRAYVALAVGHVPDAGTWASPVGGKDAVTDFRCVASIRTAASTLSMLALRPRTGRTHQLRIHASEAGAPLAGDRRYGGPSSLVATGGRVVGAARPMLHAHRVEFSYEGADIGVSSPIPVDMSEIWRALDGGAEAWEEASRSCGASFWPAS
jgi:23S rRNA-/tRNA-specific pseudouridylate synthase